MSEVIALNKKSQSRFVKKVKNVKDKVTKGVLKVKEDIKKQKRGRGLIYVGHIPHGFYEKEMTEYFTQFGTVLNVKVSRSRKTGRSKGYGFVQFLEPEVAQIAAETMDNYLMFNRRLICKYIPPEKQRRTLFLSQQWSTESYPLKTSRKTHLKLRNKNSEERSTGSTKKILNKIKRKMDRLVALGINHTFTPSNVPDDMVHLLQNKDNADAVKFGSHVGSNIESNIETIRKTKKMPKDKIKQKLIGFKVQNLGVTDLCKEIKSKSFKTIQKKKEKLRQTKIPKLSFMQNERLKRLAAAQMENKDISKKVDKRKRLINA